MAEDEGRRDPRAGGRPFRDEAERGGRALGGGPRDGRGESGFRGQPGADHRGGYGADADADRGGFVDDGRGGPGGSGGFAPDRRGRGSGLGAFGHDDDAAARRADRAGGGGYGDRFGDFTRRVEGAANVGAHRGRGPRGYQRSDERLREDVCDRLTDDPQVDASEIEVAVLNGEVTLSGSVRRREERRRAEDIADSVSGVRHVQSNLRLGQPGSGAAPDASGIAGTQIGTGGGRRG